MSSVPIPVQKLKDAQDMASKFSPESLPEGEADNVLDDGLTQEEKMLAISLLDAGGRVRTSAGNVTHEIATKKDAKGNTLSSAFSINYGWVCQCGFYPEDLGKKNQDNLLIHTNLNNIKHHALFGVFDGHGKFGTECSTYAVNTLASNITNHKKYKKDFEAAYCGAFVKTNADMHKQKKLSRNNPNFFDDTNAGTTAICVMFDGNDIIVANVGDSRAVIATNQAGMLKAKPLSVDQTPYRRDERERCQKAGAVVMTMDQLEGYKPVDPNQTDWGNEEDNDGDPPRLWMPKRGGPGVAFTRSLGDEIAEKIGCYAVPEVLRYKLCSNDQFIVIASDGVFEFLSSQQVVDMVQKFDDPCEAARAVVAEAYKLWLHYEVRTDDITAIVIFLKSFRRSTVMPKKRTKSVEFADSENSKEGSQFRMSDAMTLEKESRPVRREMSRRKRELIASMTIKETDEVIQAQNATASLEAKRDFHQVSADELELVEKAVESNFLFQHLNPEQLKMVLQAFKKIKVKKGERVIQQGTDGDFFYVVSSGTYQVFVANHEDKANGLVGNLVHTYVTNDHVVGNPSFGELTLMYSKPRAATVMATEDGELFTLDRDTFRKVLIKPPNKELVKILRSVPLLETLTKNHIQRLIDTLTEVKYKEGDVIIRQGDIGDTFFIIKEGKVRCTINNWIEKDGQVMEPSGAAHEGKEVMKIKRGGYFGERALLQSGERAANVISMGDSTCLYIARKAFEEVLGPLSSIIAAHSKKREAQAMAINQVAALQKKTGLSGVNIDVMKSKNLIMENDLGSIHLSVNESTGTVYTMKSMNIKTVEYEKQQQAVLKDKQLGMLASYNNEVEGTEKKFHFIPQILKSFVGQKSLHSMYDFVACGDLHSFMSEPFVDGTSKFVAACVVELLENSHEKNILSRAISPETLILDHDGYVRLIDLRFGKLLDSPSDLAYTMCGSAGYLAPEQILNKGHNLTADVWALGILIYEMLVGHTPFDDHEKQTSTGNVFNRITDYTVESLLLPDNLHDDAKDLLRNLIQPNPMHRLDLQSIKEHRWFSSVKWNEIADGAAASPLADATHELMTELLKGDRKPIDASASPNPSQWYHSF